MGLWRQAFSAGGARMWSLAISVTILAISSRILGEDGRGEFAASFAWAMVGSSVLFLSLGQVALHESVERGRDAAWRDRLLSTLGAFAVAFTLLGWALAAGIWFLTSGDAFKPLPGDVLMFGLFLLPFLIWEQYGSALLAMRDRVDIYNRAQILGRSLALLCTTALLLAGAGVLGLLIGLLIGQAWVALRGVRHLSGARRPPRPSGPLARTLLAGGVKLHISTVATVAITSVDVLIVAHYLGTEEAGAYQLATQLLYALTVIPQAMTLIVYGRVSASGVQEAWEEQRQIVAAAMLIVIGLSAAMVLAAPVVIDVIAGSGFRDSVDVFRIVVAGSAGFALSALMAPQWIGRGLFGLASVLTLLIASANVTANLILVPREGLDGAAIVVVGTGALMLLANAVLAIHCERRRPGSAPTPSGTTAS